MGGGVHPIPSLPPRSPSQPPVCPSPRSEKLLKGAASIPRGSLVALGTCFGKFTKTQKFRLNVTALDFLAPYAKVGARSSPGLPPPLSTPPRCSVRCLCRSTRCG